MKDKRTCAWPTKNKDDSDLALVKDGGICSGSRSHVCLNELGTRKIELVLFIRLRDVDVSGRNEWMVGLARTLAGRGSLLASFDDGVEGGEGGEGETDEEPGVGASAWGHRSG